MFSLARDTYYQVVHTLRTSLPLPGTDSPEDTALRDRAAIAHIACLLPADPEEANLAVQYVAASAQAHDSLRLAHEPSASLGQILKCVAQSASMMRQARSWRALLLRVQAERRKHDADTADAAHGTGQPAISLMAEALAHAPPAPEPVQAQQPQPDPIAEAERYAVAHRKRAVLIRSLGRLPDRLAVGRLPPAVVHAIVTGTTPLLQALGRQPDTRTALAT